MSRELSYAVQKI